ncbi:rRNA maturation RNase YbeY [Dolichospermum circinale]|uniref:rRNA maturation RNase YbeY n=1 Tax=Dolichospermum circinale TaxID=109265 RepID=UPI000401DB68|nr:rRNA maturation RNase YbeY [Dolichospermum circinale]MDB9476188.1 rRNA maturation RNase YbeY [Dolichospermum circinale CS-537/11]MDB9480212.1 rRNA maturation RNase YbeY [Dolichospermum circinale CS-537/03]MDB9483955.1 rRNA maturation RNase YbeY [Dolichospermum circinale CS-537/05]MDB9490094.1 rRNA maturation RNase YbeY [Dolichospermum circinale CS-534/05]
MPLPVELYLENCVDDFSLIPPETWENWFQEWLEILNDYLPTAPSYEVSLRLTTDTEIQTLNSQYREQDKPTDVLAFASLEANLPQSEEMLISMPLYLGDIIVSVDTAQRQAQQQEHSLSTELAWLTVHGLLHLLGWDHPDEKSLMEMLQQQVILLEKIGMIINLEV